MLTVPKHLSWDELQAGLDFIRQSPRDQGRLELIVRRPAIGQREVLATALLDVQNGLSGDNWKTRGSAKSADGSARIDAQITIMNSRAIALIAQKKEFWALAGDQLYMDIDLSEENLPPRSRLSIGPVILEITPPPHTGCKKFTDRFGHDAVRFVNSDLGKQLHLRGVNSKIIQPGEIHSGNVVYKLA